LVKVSDLLLRLEYNSREVNAIIDLNELKPAPPGAHIRIIGHITVDELRRYPDRTKCGNGFANRFLCLCVKRSKYLPDGGNLSDNALKPLVKRLAQAIGYARAIEEVTMGDHARTIWHAVYLELSEGLSGLLDAVTSRAEAQAIRLALLYALLDQSSVIQPTHLKAGLAVWEQRLSTLHIRVYPWRSSC
jgi:hypothetical protein